MLHQNQIEGETPGDLRETYDVSNESLSKPYELQRYFHLLNLRTLRSQKQVGRVSRHRWIVLDSKPSGCASLLV